MSAKTFRQEVEEILDEQCLLCPYEGTNDSGVRKVTVDRICSAAKRMGERAKKCELEKDFIYAGYNSGVKKQYRSFQAHIAKETEG